MQIGEKYDFHRENFCGLLAFATPKDATPVNFTEKILRIAITVEVETLTLVFCFESFLLYRYRRTGFNCVV